MQHSTAVIYVIIVVFIVRVCVCVCVCVCVLSELFEAICSMLMLIAVTLYNTWGHSCH